MAAIKPAHLALQKRTLTTIEKERLLLRLGYFKDTFMYVLLQSTKYLRNREKNQKRFSMHKFFNIGKSWAWKFIEKSIPSHI